LSVISDALGQDWYDAVIDYIDTLGDDKYNLSTAQRLQLYKKMAEPFFDYFEEAFDKPYLQANTTVNFTSSLTTAQIQALIDAQPKNLNNYTLTFQFADGTYTLSDILYFKNFFGGTLYILGNSSDNTAALTKSVILQKSSNNLVEIEGCTDVVLNYISFKLTNPTTSSDMCILFNKSNIIYSYNSFQDSTTSQLGIGVYSEYGSMVRGVDNYYYYLFYGVRGQTINTIFTNNSSVFSNNNTDFRAAQGGFVIYQGNAAGSGLTYSSGNAGQVFDNTGRISP